jgi:hypothetical protein
MNILKSKVFWSVGLIFGLYKGTLMGYRHGAQSGILWGIVWALTAGLIATLIVRFQKRQMSEGDKFKATLEFAQPSDKVFELCKESLGVLRKHKIQFSDLKTGKLVAKLPMTWVSSGETITFQTSTTKDGLTSLSITSEPPLPSQAYNYVNSEKILDYLNNHKQLKA